MVPKDTRSLSKKVSKRTRPLKKDEKGKKAMKQLIMVSKEDVEKLKARESRFGKNPDVALEGSASLLQSIEELEKLKARQARFGGCDSPLLEEMQYAEKLAKRVSKFGVVSSAQSLEEEKRQQRAARFGVSVNGSK
jgi:hypothetical protein